MPAIEDVARRRFLTEASAYQSQSLVSFDR